MPRLIIYALFLLIPSFLTAGASDLLTLNIWCELEPMIAEEEHPLPREEARKRILKEACSLLSSMIYVMEFSYTPYDKARDVAENLEFTYTAQLKWGDPNVKITDAETKGKRLFARLIYKLEDFQSAQRKAWASNTIPLSSGDGEANFFLYPGLSGKTRALNEAIKNAVRNHLRPVLFNKPREVTGEFLVWKAPRTIIKSGCYVTRVQIKLKIKEVRPYRIF